MDLRRRALVARTAQLFGRRYRCGRFEGGVLLDDSEFVRSGEENVEPVGYANGSMSAGSCRRALCSACRRPILIDRVAVRPDI
jgi:hypothetical protein